MDKQYKYDAFISYRHIEHNKTIAAKLQKMLETYKPPKSVCKDFKKWHVFRDETELTTSSDLSGDIKEALENSRFLIVVCSERTKESKWCMEEITYFKELHKGNNGNIITLIVDGDPSTVFPDELCNELIEVKDEAGNISYQSHVIEPLAANVAAKTTKESLKKLKSEFLRIAAPLLGCGYDTLYNRNQKRYIRKIIAIAAIIMISLFAFALYTSAMLFEINAQKSALQVANNNLKAKTEELNKSNKELQTSNMNLEKKTKEAEENFAEAEKQRKEAESNLREAERQKRIAEDNLAEAERQRKIAEDNLAEAKRQQRIAQENEAIAKEQTRVAQIENSENLSAMSENLWASGDGVEAIRTVLSALPKDGGDRPVVPDAERVLAHEIGAYSQESFAPISKVTHNKSVSLIGYAGDGTNLVTQDATGVYMWNVKTGQLTAKFLEEQYGSYVEVILEDKGEIETSGIYSNVGSTFMMDKYSIKGYKKEKGEERSTTGSDLYIYSNNSSIYKVDGKTGEVIWKITDKKNHWYAKTYLVNDKAVRQYSELGEEGYIIDIHHLDDGSLEKTYTLSDYKFPYSISAGWLSFGDKKCYYENGDILSNQIIAFDIVDNKICNPKVIFEYGEEGSYSSSKLKAAEVIDDELITLCTYTDTVIDNYAAVYVYDYNSAKEKWRYEFGSVDSTNAFVGKLYSEHTKSFCDMIFAAIGNKLVLIESNTGNLIHEYILNGNVSDVYYSKDGIIYALTNNGVEVAVYIKETKREQFDNEHYIGIYQIREFLNKPESIVYYNGSYAVTNENSNEVYVYADVKNEDFVEIFKNARNQSNSSAVMNDSGTWAVVDKGGDNLVVYNTESKAAYELNKKTDILTYHFVQEDYLSIYEKGDNNECFLCLYDLNTGKELTKVACDPVASSNVRIVGNKVALPGSEKVTFITLDGRELQWIPRNEEYIRQIVTSETGEFAAMVRNSLEIVDVTDEPACTMSISHEKFDDDTYSIVGISWIGGQVVVYFSDNTLLRFDPETGECLTEAVVELPSIISVFDIGEADMVGVLCNDSKVYKLSLSDLQVKNSVDLKNETIKIAESDSGTYKYVPESNTLIIKWRKGYIIDLDTFSVRYEIDNYMDYSPTKNIVLVNEYNVAGYYPLYTTSKLVEKAEWYLNIR